VTTGGLAADPQLEQLPQLDDPPRPERAHRTARRSSSAAAIAISRTTMMSCQFMLGNPKSESRNPKQRGWLIVDRRDL
jgi:hypothetical protein